MMHKFEHKISIKEDGVFSLYRLMIAEGKAFKDKKGLYFVSAFVCLDNIIWKVLQA